MFYILYKTTNTINNKIYVGIHATENIDDGYIGSGTKLKYAVKKYGKDKFVREILGFFLSYDDLIKAEKTIVTEEFCLRKDTYNTELGGAGGKVWTEEMKQKVSNSKLGSTPWNKGVATGSFMTAIEKEKLKIRMSGSNNHMFGVNVANVISDEKNKQRLKKISEKNRKPKSSVDNYKEYAKKRKWMVNETGCLKHYIDENDPRLLSGEYKKGMKWYAG